MSSGYTGVTMVGVGVAKKRLSIFCLRKEQKRERERERFLSTADVAQLQARFS